MKVPASEPTSSPETPKSQILNWPSRVTRMLEGLMSDEKPRKEASVSLRDASKSRAGGTHLGG